MKKIISLLLIVLLVLSLSACDFTDTYPSSNVGGNADEEEKSTRLDGISLVYFSDRDGHPLLETSLANQRIHQAVYQPPFTFDENLNIVYGCADSVQVSGKSVTISPDTSRRFSDGSTITPSLIAQSYQFVLNHSESPYHRQLSGIESVGVQSGSVVLSLRQPDPSILYCLDIPIVKEADGKYYGCGDYVISTYRNEPALCANPESPTPPTLAPIPLLNPASEAAMASMFNSGVLDALSSDMMQSGLLTLTRKYQSVGYLSHTMLYLGVNDAEESLDASMRQALSLLIPREDIVENVLMGDGVATAHPFYPKWSALPKESLAVSDKTTLLQAFEKAGLCAKNGELFHADGTKPSYDLLICEDNKTHAATAQKMSSAAAVLGLELRIVTVTREAFLSRLEDGRFDLYLARYTFTPNMDPSPLYAENSADNYRTHALEELEQAWEKYQNGEGELQAYLDLFDQELPFLPIAFIKNTLYYTEGINLSGQISASAPLGDISSWSAK